MNLIGYSGMMLLFVVTVVLSYRVSRLTQRSFMLLTLAHLYLMQCFFIIGLLLLNTAYTSLTQITNCTDLAQPDYLRFTRLKKTGYDLIAVCFLCFVSLHSLFAVKYWLLS